MSTYNIGDCTAYKVLPSDPETVNLGIVIAVNQNITIQKLALVGNSAMHFKMPLVKCDGEMTYLPCNIQVVLFALVLPAKYYTSGYGADLYQSQLNKLVCFDGILDVFEIDEFPHELADFFTIPKFYGQSDMQHRRAVTPSVVLELITSKKQQYQARAFGLYKRVSFLYPIGILNLENTKSRDSSIVLAL